jgi:hypothetical protein
MKGENYVRIKEFFDGRRWGWCSGTDPDFSGFDCIGTDF